ncbi:hypothetical protein LOD99_11193 [Oopsacas minuta]|uniref:Uncharacterized protein n=1 Tax=Oopsacas minuta TaxID=111878 RepID=A0AAV7K962_9METZ|nr:hypothetical protein LOD99_11193 [Oopsacas minuta]
MHTTGSKTSWPAPTPNPPPPGATQDNNTHQSPHSDQYYQPQQQANYPAYPPGTYQQQTAPQKTQGNPLPGNPQQSGYPTGYYANNQQQQQQYPASTASHNDQITVTLATAAPPLSQTQGQPPRSEAPVDKGYNYGAWVSNCDNIIIRTC